MSENLSVSPVGIIKLLSLVPIESLTYQILGSAIKNVEVGEHKSDVTFSTQAIKAGDEGVIHGLVIWVKDEDMQKAHAEFKSQLKGEDING